MILGLVVVVIVVAVVVIARLQSGTAPKQEPDQRVHGDLDRWQAAGLLTSEQVDAIARYEAERHPADTAESSVPATASVPAGPSARRPRPVRATSRVPLVAEALGYLGGILAGVGVVLVVAHYWEQFALATQVGLTAGASAALWGLGALVARDGDPALERMRSLVWAASSATAGACALVVAHDGVGTEDAATLTLATAAVVGIHSGSLWQGKVRPVQQLVALAAAVVAVGAATASLAPEGWWGGTVWLVGATFVGLGLVRRGPTPALTAAIGAVSMVVGAIAIASTWEHGGNLFLVATALAIASVALVPQAVPASTRWILGGIGAWAMLFSVPSTVAWYAQDAGAITGAVLWLAGGALVALGLTQRVHLPLVVQGLGAITMLAGAAVTAAQWPAVAPALGLVTAIGLLAIGTRPGAVLASIAGCIGLLVYVPWAVARWFPGESRAPILLVVSGLLIVAIAVAIGRMSGRMRRELGPHRRAPAGP